MRRFLHTFPEAPELAGRNIIHATPIVDPRIPQVPSFRVMGQGSMLQVQLPASVNLLAKRNSLTGILGPSAGNAALTSRIKIARSPFARLLGRQPILQQKIISTSPLTCLLGAQNRHLSALELNGSLDWVVKSPIIASSGRQLHFNVRSGWRLGASAPPFAHTEVSGRGWLCLSTPAPPVQITVAEGEQILVSKAHLNAYSVDSNAAHKSPTITHVNFEFPTLENKEQTIEDAPQNWWNQAKGYWSLVRAVLKRFTLAGTPSPFLEIYGPATVLVSSATKPPKRVDDRADSGREISKREL